MSKALTERELVKALARLPEWKLEGGRLVRTWKFAMFVEAMQFVNRVALVAETADHHPDIDIRYDKVTLGLWSHDVGGISRRDVRLAEQLG